MIQSWPNRPDSVHVGILGASGDLGSTFMNYLLQNGLKVCAQSRIESLPRAKLRVDYRHPSATWIHKEIFDLQTIQRFFFECQSIYCFAGLCGLNFQSAMFSEVLAVNGFFYGVISAAIPSTGVQTPFFAFPSTQRVHLFLGDPVVTSWVDRAVSEFDLECSSIISCDYTKTAVIEFCNKMLRKYPLPPGINIYELSKLVGERFVKRLTNYTILRISSVYGPGCWPRGKIQRVIYSLLHGSTIFEADDYRDYIFIDDLNEILFSLQDNVMTGTNNFYELDLASGQHTYLRDVLKIIERYLLFVKGKVLLNEADTPLIPTDKTKASSLLRRGFCPVDAGILETVLYYQNEFTKSASSLLFTGNDDGSKDGMVIMGAA